MANMFGTESTLYIKTVLSNNRTKIEDSYFTAPLKIVKPFYNNEQNMAEIMIMSASAGIMEGDRYLIQIEVGEASAISLQCQSYSKIHKMPQGCAKQRNLFIVRDGGLLDYKPKPTIPFRDSDFISDTSSYLYKGSRYIYSEILACGRDKSGEQFEFRRYKSHNRVYYCDKLIFLDNQDLKPEIQNLKDIGFFEGYTHQATFAYFDDGMHQETMIESLYEKLQKYIGIEAGISAVKFGVVIRLLANGSDYLECIIGDIRSEIYDMQTLKRKDLLL